MKKHIYSLFLAVVALAALTACSSKDEHEYQWASASGEQVYFNSETAATIDTPTDQSSFTVTLYRVKTDGELTVPLTITQSEGSIYTPAANQVTFADGEATAELVFTYDPADIEYGKYYDINISIADESLTTPYGLNALSIKAGMSEWVPMSGKGSYREGFILGLYGLPSEVWQVDIEESVATPGKYRVKAPYAPTTGFASIAVNTFGFFSNASDLANAYTDSEDNDMVLDASDPEHVVMYPFNMGYSKLNGDLDGKVGFTSYAYVYISRGNSFDDVVAAYPQYFGKLKDGIITFENGRELLTTLDGSLAYYGNLNSDFAVALPGYVLKDYGAELEYAGVFTNTAGEVFAQATLELSKDVTVAKAVVVEADAEPDAVADAIAAGDLEAIDVESGTIYVPIPEDLTGKLRIVVAIIDGDELKNYATEEFEYYGGGVNPWKSLGVGYFVDDLILPLFGYDAEPYEVEIQENTETPGLYRLVAMMAGVAADFGSDNGNGDILVHAENPNAVYIPLQDTKLTIGNYGPFSISTDAGELVEEYGFNAVYAQLPDIFGTLSEGVISFPSLEEESSSGATVSYQTWVVFGGQYYFGGRNGLFQIVLPSAAQSVKEKARRAASASSFARRLNFSGASRKQAGLKNLHRNLLLKKAEIKGKL